MFTLYVKAELENVARLQMPKEWHIVLQQSGGDETRSVIVDPSNVEEITGSRGECNFKLKWQGGKKESYLNVMVPKGSDLALVAGGDFTPIVSFDCRGFEPIEWNYRESSFELVDNSGTKYSDVSLAEGDWFEYDEIGGESVGVTNLEYKFQRS